MNDLPPPPPPPPRPQPSATPPIVQMLKNKKYIAEFVGTFVLVFGGCGSAIFGGQYIGALGVSIAFGLTLLTMAYAIGHISGCHINPAVTIGLVIAGRHEKKDLAGYVVAQVVGGIIAALLLWAIAEGRTRFVLDPDNFACNGFGDHSPAKYGLLSCLLAEIVLTALLLFVVIGATDKKSPAGFAGLPIGLVLVLIHLVGIPITNTSVNPARSIGVAIVAHDWALEQLWLFVVAPIAGGAAGAFLYRFLRPREEEAVIEDLAR